MHICNLYIYIFLILLIMIKVLHMKKKTTKDVTYPLRRSGQVLIRIMYSMWFKPNWFEWTISFDFECPHIQPHMHICGCSSAYWSQPHTGHAGDCKWHIDIVPCRIFIGGHIRYILSRTIMIAILMINTKFLGPTNP